jgi:hypothetical protein
MSEETKTGIKHQSWKWVGALFMKPKKDADGNSHMAVDFTKVQKLVSLLMALVLFIVIVIVSLAKSQIMADTGVATDPVSPGLYNMFWGTLAMNGVNMVAGAYYGKGNGNGK